MSKTPSTYDAFVAAAGVAARTKDAHSAVAALLQAMEVEFTPTVAECVSALEAGINGTGSLDSALLAVMALAGVDVEPDEAASSRPSDVVTESGDELETKRLFEPEDPAKADQELEFFAGFDSHDPNVFLSESGTSYRVTDVDPPKPQGTRPAGIDAPGRTPMQVEPTAGGPRLMSDTESGAGNSLTGVATGFDSARASTTETARIRPVSDGEPDQPVDELVDRVKAVMARGDLAAASAIAEEAIRLDPGHGGALRIRAEITQQLATVRVAALEPLDRVPRADLTKAVSTQLTPREMFVLTQADGSLSLEDLIEVSGMSADEAASVLSELIREGLLEFS